jgi:hypothetical protein
MTTHVDRKLEELGLTLPEAAAPVAAYVPVVEAGGMLHLSGQLPFKDGQLVTGRLGDGVSLEQGQEAARLCGLMIVAQVKKHLGGDLSRTDGCTVRRRRQARSQRGRRPRPAAGRGGRSRRDYRTGVTRLGVTPAAPPRSAWCRR